MFLPGLVFGFSEKMVVSDELIKSEKRKTGNKQQNALFFLGLHRQKQINGLVQIKQTAVNITVKMIVRRGLDSQTRLIMSFHTNMNPTPPTLLPIIPSAPERGCHGNPFKDHLYRGNDVTVIERHRQHPHTQPI